MKIRHRNNQKRGRGGGSDSEVKLKVLELLWEGSTYGLMSCSVARTQVGTGNGG